MNDIQRYEPCPQEWPNEDANGDLVTYEDHRKAVEAVEAKLAKLVDAAEKVINSYWHSTDGVITGIYDLEAALARVKGETK